MKGTRRKAADNLDGVAERSGGYGKLGSGQTERKRRRDLRETRPEKKQ